MSVKKNKIIMLGFLVEKDYFDEITKFDLYPQVAARKQELGYLTGFVENHLNVDVFGFCPSSTYPRNKKFFFGFRRWSILGCDCYRVPFINFIGLKSISRVISLLACLIRFLRLNNEPIKICVYSTHTPSLMVANVIKNQKTNGFADFMEACHFTDKIFNKDVISLLKKYFVCSFVLN
jgi:hypothetical protein